MLVIRLPASLDAALRAVRERTCVPLVLVLTTSSAMTRRIAPGSSLGIRRLVRALSAAVRPVFLRIERTDMGDASCAALARAMQRGSTLRRLCMVENPRVSDHGLALLAHAASTAPGSPGFEVIEGGEQMWVVRGRV